MPRILDNKYTLGRMLGEGGFCQVWDATDDANNKYAIKTWIKFNDKMFEDESRATQVAEHPHLVKYLYSAKGQLQDTDSGNVENVHYILMEHVSGGELLETLMDHGGFNESIARYFFRQMLMGMNNLHQQGLCHRDLKPENILFTADEYDIKITDFGFLLPLEGRDRTAWLKSRVGTLTYMAPEVLARDTYRGTAIDIYSLGVILFVLYLGNMPMEQASSDDKFFKCLSSNRTELFWQTHQKNLPDQPISQDFQDLITLMINPDSNMRIDLGDIICHPWMQGPMADKTEVIAEMERRKAASKEMADQSRAGSAKMDDEGRVYRDFVLGAKTYVVNYENAAQEDDPNVQSLKLREDKDSRTSRLKTTFKPDEVFTKVFEYLKTKEVAPENIRIVDDEWKLEFEAVKTIVLKQAGDDDNEEEKFDAEANTLQEVSKFVLEVISDGNDSSYLTFKKKSGSILVAREFWTGIQENVKLQE